MTHFEDHTVVSSRRGYVREVLSRIEAFQHIPPAMLDQLAGEFRAARAAVGDVLVRQGDKGDQLFVVEDGDLEVTAEMGGRSKRLGTLTRGDVFGEFALVSGTNRIATVTALTPSRLWTLSADAFKEWTEKSPELEADMRAVMRRREISNALKALQ